VRSARNNAREHDCGAERTQRARAFRAAILLKRIKAFASRLFFLLLAARCCHQFLTLWGIRIIQKVYSRFYTLSQEARVFVWREPPSRGLAEISAISELFSSSRSLLRDATRVKSCRTQLASRNSLADE